MHKLFTLMLLTCLGISTMQAQKQLTTTQLTELCRQSGKRPVSIHDPSVVYNPEDKYFYIIGSHIGFGRSKDLCSYEGLNNAIFGKYDANGRVVSTGFGDAFKKNPTRKVMRTLNGVTEEVDFPSFDAAAWCASYSDNEVQWVSGDMWAPDMVYNKNMKKWCMYLSLNGDRWASTIILLTSDKVTGPFVYQGPVVTGGFINTTNPKIDYKKTDLQLVLGKQNSLPARYNRDGANGEYWPNCIDPCSFFDENGELWLAYGSWSGGIFMLKLDKETGLRDYTYTYPAEGNDTRNNWSDPYFGRKIAGGYYVSGEGPYIQHIGDYYYLFMSYGGFAPDGGYEMRIFRSKNPDGPYVDAMGNNATFTGYQLNYGARAGTDKGMKLLGAYNNWGIQNVGECAQGHNSAIVDEQGRAFVVYHTKFNDGTVGHQVRTHQLFVNKSGWLVASPFSFAGETVNDDSIASGCPFTAEQIAGDYNFMLHPYRLNHNEYQEVTPTTVTLTPDGKVKGAYTGTWNMTEGTAYVTLKLNNVIYNGVVVEQTVDGATRQNYQGTTMKAIAFTAVSTGGVPVWGYKLQDDHAIAYNYTHNTIGVKAGQSISGNVSLMFPTVENTTLTWESSAPEIISNTGKYCPPSERTQVLLTARLECGNSFWEQEYKVYANTGTTVDPEVMNGIVAYYDFDEKPIYNKYKAPEAEDYDRVTLTKTGTGESPALEADYDRFGQFYHQSGGAAGNNSYGRMPNPLLDATGTEGFTVSAWVKRNDSDNEGVIWCIGNTYVNGTSTPRFYLTGNGCVAFNDNDGHWFTINDPAKTYTDIPVGEWNFVTVTVGAENGVRLYVNGLNKSFHTVSSSNGITGTTASSVRNLEYAQAVSTILGCRYMMLGMGYKMGSADVSIDDLLVHNRELSASEARSLNAAATRVFDFAAGENGTAVESVPAGNGENPAQQGIYDLMGRRFSQLPRTGGLFIVNGRKVNVLAK